MSSGDAKAIVRRWYAEFWNAGKLEAADELLHTDYVYRDGYGAGAPSVAAAKAGCASWHRILPDLHVTIEDLIAEDETLAVRWTARGTHHGDWETEIGTIPASGKKITAPGASCCYLCDGKIIRDVNYLDALSLMVQIGACVKPGDAGS
jgi:steroid delta-isomerase-like uncharacterized protein